MLDEYIRIKKKNALKKSVTIFVFFFFFLRVAPLLKMILIKKLFSIVRNVFFFLIF